VSIETERRADGKLYPVRCLTPAERAGTRVLAHRLHCRDRLTVRAAQRIMAAGYGLRRSLGAISKDLTGWECPLCAEPGSASAPAGAESSPAASPRLA
jgi:hypothetical protein